jgi:hypothetical protein
MWEGSVAMATLSAGGGKPVMRLVHSREYVKLVPPLSSRRPLDVAAHVYKVVEPTLKSTSLPDCLTGFRRHCVRD